MPVDPDKLHQIVERVQVGDQEEGVQALTEFAEMVGGGNAANAYAAAQEVDIQKRIKAEGDEAMDHFKKRYAPPLAEKKHATPMALSMLRDELESDIRKTGKASDEDLSRIGGNPNLLFQLHSRARIGGCEGLRSPKEIVDTVGTAVCRELNVKPVGIGRSGQEYVRDLKAARGFATSDEDSGGRRDGSRAPNAGRLTAEQEEKSRRAIQQMRAARGFPPQG